MRPDARAVIVLLSVLLSAACSSPPAPKSDTAAKLMVGAQATPASATAVATGPNGGTDVDPQLVKEGYRAVKGKSGVKYCRTAVMTGTRLASTVCLTKEQIALQKQSTQDTNDTLNRARAISCKTMTCGT